MTSFEWPERSEAVVDHGEKPAVQLEDSAIHLAVARGLAPLHRVPLALPVSSHQRRTKLKSDL